MTTETSSRYEERVVMVSSVLICMFQSTLNKTRENNKTNCAKTMVQALIYKFNELKEVHGGINRNSEEFHGIKELAKRFALSFGLDALKNREAVAGLHREG